MELPFSGTREVRNLWVYSNFDQSKYPGLWLYEVNQDPQNEKPFAFPVDRFPIENLDLKTICSGPLVPDIAPIYENSLFNISNCILPSHDKVSFKIVGQFTSSFAASYDEDIEVLRCQFRWFEAEPVAIFVQLDDVTIPGHFTAYFVDSTSLSDVRSIGVEVNDDFTVITLNFSECIGNLSSFTANYVEANSSKSVYWIHPLWTKILTEITETSSLTGIVPSTFNKSSNFTGPGRMFFYAKCLLEQFEWYGIE